MNNAEFVRLVSVFVVGVVFILCSSCGTPTTDNDKGQSAPTIISEPDAQSVSESFGDLTIEDGFEFETQRVVELDIRFAHRQNLTYVSIYSEVDSGTGKPIRLLEESQLQNTDRYHSLVTVPGYVQALIAVIDGDLHVEKELPITRDKRINYTFE